jgi:thioredoxin-related protein
LDKEVYKSSEFAEYAKKNLVLLKVDFPKPNNLPKALQEANEALSDKYKIEAFPTAVVTDAEGKELGREEGYGGDGPKKFVATIDKLRNKK